MPNTIKLKFLTLVFLSTVCPCVVQAGTESVSLIKVLDDKDSGIIERSNGERWLIEKGVGALSFWRFEGKRILIHSPTLFCGVGSKVILSNVGQEARIWKAERIDHGGKVTNEETAQSAADLTILALQFLGYYSPDSEEKIKNDVVIALKSFQKKSRLEQTGKLSSATQLALAKAVSAKKPQTAESLRLASSLLESAATLSVRQTLSNRSSASGDNPTATTTIESQIDGEFEGWDGETVVKLTNGQIWQQTEYHYHYHYAYMPTVVILKSGTSYKMIVDGVPKAIGVTQLK